jgi:RND family efflux transporter MFP subunit
MMRPDLAARSVSLLIALALAGACRPVGDSGEDGKAQVPVHSEVLERAPFRTSRVLLGRVEPAVRTPVLATLSGRISFPARFSGGLRTGERVRRGELLATIENLDRENAWRDAEVRTRAARAAAEREERTFKAGVTNEAQLERVRFELESAETQLENMRRNRGESSVLAPAAGILRLDPGAPAPGSRVDAGTVLAELAGDGPLEIELWASAADLEFLAVGARVFCRLSGSDQVRGEGRLVELDLLLDQQGLARGLARIDKDQGMPRPGSGVEVEVEGAEIAGLTVPEAAIVRRGGVATLFVLENRGNGYLAKARAVTLGPAGGGRLSIESGVQAGERVAVLGADLLADGTNAIEATPTAGKGSGR